MTRAAVRIILGAGVPVWWLKIALERANGMTLDRPEVQIALGLSLGLVVSGWILKWYRLIDSVGASNAGEQYIANIRSANRLFAGLTILSILATFVIACCLHGLWAAATISGLMVVGTVLSVIFIFPLQTLQVYHPEPSFLPIRSSCKGR